MDWNKTSYEVINTLSDRYFFAGSAWNTQAAKRFILKTKRFGKIIESSYYLHLTEQGAPVNVAFEPSTSFGCSVGCLFCASGTLFPVQSLNAEEIAQQVHALVAIYREDFPDYSDVRGDVFYSGIGEPTLQMNTLLEASSLTADAYPNLGFKMSTMGAVPSALLRWANSDLPLRSLQVGIPHWDEAKIKYLYSKSPKYDLQAVLEHVGAFMALRPETSIKINYIGIKQFNDSVSDLCKTIERISAVLGNNVELKLSCLNPTDFAKNNQLQTLDQHELATLAQAAATYGLKRVYTFGPMSAKKLGCGQLAGHYSA